MPHPPMTSLADLRAARVDLENRLEARQRELGPDDPALADDLRDLGRLVHELGDLNDAAALLERARVLHAEAFGANHPEVATDLAICARHLHAHAGR
jgi:kinesin light chain